jgi:hypothetical protein
MAGVAIKDGTVTILDLTGMVHNDNLGGEVLGVHSGDVLGIGSNVTSLDVLDGKVLNVETNIVSGLGLSDLLVMHLDGFDLSGDTERTEADLHVGLDDTSLDSADGDCSNTRDLVDILERKSEGLEDGSLGRLDGIKSLNEARSFVPRHVIGGLEHVVTVPTRDGDERNVGNVVTNLLKIEGNLSLDFLISLLLVVSTLGVHLVAANNHLLDTHGEGKKCVFSGLTFLGPSRLELTGRRGNHEDGNISLGGTSDHVLDEISVAGSINDGEARFLGLELPEGDINGDTSLTFGLKFIEYPSVFESSLTHLVGFLLELFDGSLIDTTTLVDHVAGRGGLAGVDVTDDDE